MPEAVIVSSARTPIGRAGKGSLVDMRADELTLQAVSAAMAKVPAVTPDMINDLYMGCGLPTGEQGSNMGRSVAVMLGWDQVPGTTITRFCSSSVQTSRMAFHAIKAGEGDVFVSAGAESQSRLGIGGSREKTSNPRYDASRERTTAAGVSDWSDPRIEDLLPNLGIPMMQTAENVARLRGITREECDEFGVRSQNLAEAAIASGFWKSDITPVTLPDGTVVAKDDGPRAGVSLEALAKLNPIMEGGVVTAGNCCPMNDGAAAVVITSDAKAAELGLKPLARIVATGVSALSPEIMGLGPVEATRRALAIAGMSVNDIDLWEINEAFAAQVIPTIRDLEIDIDRVNVNGGAIAVGHPYGMTGARLQNTLINSMQWHDKQTGLITMCVAGGMGMALILERIG